MKKFAVTFIAVVILVFFSANSFVQARSMPGTIKGINYSRNGDCDIITISIDSYDEISTFKLGSPDRIVIDITNASAPGRQQVISIGSTLIKTVRYAQFDEGIARVVLDVEGMPKYKIENRAGYIKVFVSRTGNFSADSSGLIDRGDIDRKELPISASFGIEYVSDEGREKIIVTTDDYKGYRVFTLLEPDRIVIDIPNAKAPGRQQQIDIDSKTTQSIRYAQFNKDTARIVVDMKQNYGFEVSEEKGYLVINIDNPAFNKELPENVTLSNGNISYYNNGDRVCVELEGVRLTKGGLELEKLYTEEYDERKMRYTITFPSELGELEEKEIKIGDRKLESIKVTKNRSKGTTSIQFNAKDNFSYLPFSRTDANDTAITILKPASKADRLVVIDAGHGGALEPGAIYGSLKEKDLNLDIALRLNNLLKKNKVKTYMIREDDSYIHYSERPHIANMLNASLYLSIHNNAMTDPGYSGTMTLIYSRDLGSGFNSYRFAGIVHNNLLGELGTVDRQIRERPDLAVLRGTKMPAVLAEIAFMTNAGDRANLQNEAFRQKTAQALCDSILQSLKELK
ncbi:MAG: N-acetylmuramoyl-L-alanine amidase [Acetivibrionales bacterium]|jgi:N-acetylmuramoyl-L-alanine amidase